MTADELYKMMRVVELARKDLNAISLEFTPDEEATDDEHFLSSDFVTRIEEVEEDLEPLERELHSRYLDAVRKEGSRE